jgi:hypothetical protein
MPGQIGMSYDVDNRVWQATTGSTWEQYAYGADNKRVLKRKPNGSEYIEEVYFYGVTGQRLGSYIPQVIWWNG